MSVMRVDERSKGAAINRLRRVRGQIDGIIAMLEDDRDCAEVATQISAASKALHRTGFTVVLSGLEQCIVADPAGDLDPDARRTLEKLFLSLA